MNQFTCKDVKQINNRISLNIDIHLYHSYLSAFFVNAGVPNGEFPEILIAKCRSRFFGTWFFSRAEDFESWRMGPSKSGEKCSRRKVHMYNIKNAKTKKPIMPGFVLYIEYTFSTLVCRFHVNKEVYWFLNRPPPRTLPFWQMMVNNP
jgi:hypothetical protein